MKRFTSVIACGVAALAVAGGIGLNALAFEEESATPQIDTPVASEAKAVAVVAVADEKTDADSPKKKEDRLMKAKQTHAQNIFAGLTEGDFKKVEEGARLMFGANIVEKWLAKRDFEDHYAYEGEMNALNYSLKELVRHSKQKNIDGALNAYVSMSRTCVQCHKLIRD